MLDEWWLMIDVQTPMQKEILLNVVICVLIFIDQSTYSSAQKWYPGIYFRTWLTEFHKIAIPREVNQFVTPATSFTDQNPVDQLEHLRLMRSEWK